MLTNGQKQALHSAARKVGIEEGQRRLIQWNVGGFYSAADKTASRLGYIAVMAFYEGLLAERSQLLARTAGYWSDELAKAVKFPAAGLAERARRLATDLAWDEAHLTNWLRSRWMTSDPAAQIDDLNVYWLRKAVDGLTNMLRRRASTDHAAR